MLDALGIERAVLAGASMGAHTIARFALDHPERVTAMGLITPAYDPTADTTGPDAFAGWDALARGLREGGVEGFLAAYDFSTVPGAWRATVETVVRQRLSAHDHPDAVADALEVVPRSRPFEHIEELSGIEAPTLVIASRDEADPGHPLAVGERYTQAIPGARLIVENPGQSPLAWQGGQLSKALWSSPPALKKATDAWALAIVRDNVHTYARCTQVGRADIRPDLRADAGHGPSRPRSPEPRRQ